MNGQISPRCRLLAVFALVASAQPALAQAPDPLAARVDAVFARFDGRDSPGCAVAVMRDGRVVLERGYGMADLQHDVPITPASIFHVASISKQFTAMSIALLAQQGRLSLDDDIRQHVPELPDFGTPITIRHLIHHTSGLRDQWTLLNLAGWRADDPKTEQDIMELVSRQKELNFAPGERHLYSNTGYTLMAVIVKRVSGKSLREFADEHIFRPLGMTSTHFHDDHRMIVKGRTSAYEPRESGGYEISIPVFDNHGATSLFTTVRDLAKWDRNLHDGRVGGSALLDLMHERGRLNGGEEIAYAFALVHGRHEGLRTVGHGGADAGYRADFLRFPDQRLTVSVLCNVSDSNPGSLSRKVASLYLADEIRAAQQDAAAPRPAYAAAAPDPNVEIYAGAYWNERTESLRRIAVVNGGLAAQADRHIELVPLGDGRFTVKDDESIQLTFRPAAGGGMHVEVRGGNGRSQVYARMPPAAPDDRLDAYEGTFHSEELGVDWAVVTQNGQLTVRRRKFPDQPLEPAFANAFTTSSGMVLRFTRGTDGRITGFDASLGRVKHLRFVRR